MTYRIHTGGQQLRSIALLVVALLGAAVASIASGEAAIGDASADSQADLEALVARIKSKIETTRPMDRSKEAFAAELQSFDTLLRRYEGRADEEALAMILFKKATLYYQVFKEHELAISTMQELCRRFPESERRDAAAAAIELIGKDLSAAAIRKRLEPGTPFPPFSATTMSGEIAQVGSEAGSLALVHFWSFECDLCKSEMPKFKALYEEYGDRGFSMIGISVDENLADLRSYLSEKQIAWPQIADGRGWSGELFTKYGVKSIPETYLIDEEGRIVARNLPIDSLPSFLDQYLEE